MYSKTFSRIGLFSQTPGKKIGGPESNEKKEVYDGEGKKVKKGKYMGKYMGKYIWLRVDLSITISKTVYSSSKFISEITSVMKISQYPSRCFVCVLYLPATPWIFSCYNSRTWDFLPGICPWCKYLSVSRTFSVSWFRYSFTPFFVVLCPRVRKTEN